MDYHVTDQERDAYRRDGAVPLRGVVDGDWLEILEAGVERDISEPGPFFHGYVPDNGVGKFHGNIRLWENDSELGRFCTSGPLVSVAAQLFESSKVNLFYDQLFVKEQGTENRTRWHNDLPYWPIRGSQIMSFWVALDDVTLDSGALEFLKASHLADIWYQPETFGKTSGHGEYERNPDYVDMPDVEATRNDYEILTWDLEPGDVYAFHAMTVHGAGGNLRSDVRRRGYTVRYCGDDAVYDTRKGTQGHLQSDRHRDGDSLDSDLYPVVWQAH
ncbi:MAG: phytanoyl-CoA dioxygenase family protein [Actinomycetota bacterium]|nr:phytanoyl-CoA dioxygenase family protein [Acidimicrobiales bacterium]MEC8921295.1 phytanoyl-CoA dioxygenase family protein [Actinomycetota bacterium]MED5551376.1 phytanoyl-CoA dioxygenase family protein [Actinomycetota bacterium]MEE2680263.1 phytanoyl-CoA dioxygenase family protein [Actinomycetota bacterium]MEE3140041.1 phytanoyl-CoA dioxygenase family protein [Actinomycetota bacterium]